MSIKKKVSDEQENIDNFISKGGKVAADNEDKPKFINVLIRFPASILEEIDKNIKRQPWYTRTSWIVSAAQHRLDDIQNKKD